MNWKNRLTNYNFWISLCSAVLLILQAFNFKFDVAYMSEIVTGVLGLLVVIGIISDPTKTSVKQDTTPASKDKKEDKDTLGTSNLPIDEKDEIDYVNLSHNIQAIFDKISQDLKDSINLSRDIMDKVSSVPEENVDASVPESENVESGSIEATNSSIEETNAETSIEDTISDEHIATIENNPEEVTKYESDSAEEMQGTLPIEEIESKEETKPQDEIITYNIVN